MPDPSPTTRPPAPLVVAQIVTDNREPFRQYDRPDPWFGTAPEALYQGFAALPDVQVHLVTCTQRPMVSSPEKLADNIWFHSLVVPKLGWLRTGYQGCIRAVRRKLREIRPDIVHAQGTERYCALAAVFSGFPNVLTIHGNMRLVAKINHARPFTFDWLAARLEGFTVPRTGGVICITNYTREAVAADRVRTWLLPNAVDQEFFPIQPIAESPPIILCVGNVTVRKNQNAFIRALDPVAAQGGFHLICVGLAGDDPYSQEFKELVSTRPWVTHIHWADRPALRDWFRKSTLLALPTLEDNCPMVVLEAMAAGVPVAAANVGGIPDLIEDGLTGLLCNPLDAPSMAEAVGRLLRESPLAHALAENARRKALATHLPEVVARRHLQIYRELLLGKPSDVENALRGSGSAG